MKLLRKCLLFYLILNTGYWILSSPSSVLGAPALTSITDNRASYPNAQIPAYEKLEITFELSTPATNLQFPYDPAPPPGILDPATNQPFSRYNGVTVNAIFTSPSGKTHTQPAFYYQEFLDQNKNDQYAVPKEWFYPTGNYSWKVRFAPDEPGLWQYQLTAQDATGSTTGPSSSFTAASSPNHGFIRLAQNDRRYFEFSDGTYFPGLGYNMNYDQIDWINPVLSNQTNFATMGQNGIQLIRMWLSQWSIWGSAWNPWSGLRGDYDGYIPRAGLINYGAASSANSPSALMVLVYSEDASGNKNAGSWFEACRFLGGWGYQPPVKQSTKYKFKVRYRAEGITGPRNASFPNFGLVAKIQNPNDGNWHWNCYEPGDPTSGVKVSYAYGQNSATFTTLEGEWNSGTSNFFPLFYLAIENANNFSPVTNWHPTVYIDSVTIGEDLGNNQIGPNIVPKASMEHLTYFMDRNAYAFDKVVDLAKQNNIYLRPVILEKNEVSQNEIGYDGNKASADNNNFYGNYRTMTAVRWLQQAYWRYLQARWGYSPNIQSWELLNEGDPWNDRHYTLADEFGKFMHQFGPNSHLVSTSTWHSFPVSQFWANGSFPDVDFADLHQYVDKTNDPGHFYDTALMTFDPSIYFGAKQTGGAGKPVVRGETGLTDAGTEPGTAELLKDTGGLWLHNFLWGQINPGGMLESYWYSGTAAGHIYGSNFDHRGHFGKFYQFIKDIPLNNGRYADAGATSTNTNLRIWGQKDLVSKRAHLWIANKNHTWKNVVDNVAITPITTSVTLAGFTPNTSYPVATYNTYTGLTTSNQQLATDNSGNLILSVNNLIDDYAVKIGDYTSTSPITDINRDGKIDILDLARIINARTSGTITPYSGPEDVNTDGKLDSADLNLFLQNYTHL